MHKILWWSYWFSVVSHHTFQEAEKLPLAPPSTATAQPVVEPLKGLGFSDEEEEEESQVDIQKVSFCIPHHLQLRLFGYKVFSLPVFTAFFHQSKMLPE